MKKTIKISGKKTNLSEFIAVLLAVAEDWGITVKIKEE